MPQVNGIQIGGQLLTFGAADVWVDETLDEIKNKIKFGDSDVAGSGAVKELNGIVVKDKNDLLNEIGQNRSEIEVIKGDGEGSFKKAIADSLKGMGGGLDKQIVEEPPTVETAEEGVLYLVEIDADKNIYMQYLLVTNIDGEKEIAAIGASSVDLSPATSENDGLMTSEHVRALNTFLEGKQPVNLFNSMSDPIDLNQITGSIHGNEYYICETAAKAVSILNKPIDNEAFALKIEELKSVDAIKVVKQTFVSESNRTFTRIYGGKTFTPWVEETPFTPDEKNKLEDLHNNVHIGTEAPTDGSEIWIDTSVNGLTKEDFVVANYEEYSETEIIIGKWIDGRPIYRRTVPNLTMPQATTSGTEVSSTFKLNVSIDTLVSEQGYIFATATKSYMQIPNSKPDGSTTTRFSINKDGLITLSNSNPNINASTVTIIVEYTKAIDVANSFNPQMLPTAGVNLGVFNNYVNYSADETIVGKWIDGTVIYRKIIEMSALPNNTQIAYPHKIENLNHVVKIEGFAYNSSTFYPLPFIDPANISNGIKVSIDKTNINIADKSNFSALKGIMTIEYTKL